MLIKGHERPKPPLHKSLPDKDLRGHLGIDPYIRGSFGSNLQSIQQNPFTRHNALSFFIVNWIGVSMGQHMTTHPENPLRIDPGNCPRIQACSFHELTGKNPLRRLCLWLLGRGRSLGALFLERYLVKQS